MGQILRDEVTKENVHETRRGPLFEIFALPDGQNSRGNWVVQDQRGMCGGIFVNRPEALRFALFEHGHRPQGVVMVPGVFELDMNRGAGKSPRLPLNFDSHYQRRAA
jgi:hypothetical protein